MTEGIPEAYNGDIANTYAGTPEIPPRSEEDKWTVPVDEGDNNSRVEPDLPFIPGHLLKNIKQAKEDKTTDQ